MVLKKYSSREESIIVLIKSRDSDKDTVRLLGKILKSTSNLISITSNNKDCLNDYCNELKYDYINTENKLVISHSEPREKKLGRKYFFDSNKKIIPPNWFICPREKANLIVLLACNSKDIVSKTNWSKYYDQIVTFDEVIPFAFDTLALRWRTRRFIKKLRFEIGKNESLTFSNRFNDLIDNEINKNEFFHKYFFQDSTRILSLTLESLKD